jgi:tRNA threonylcarbamoyladenosine biosynthesis protein TsaE
VKLRAKSPEDTKEVGAALASLVRSGDIILLAGDLGAGKTTFTQGFGRGLGVTDPITSPTFTLLRHHPGRLQLLHADVYRLDHLEEITDLSLTELVEEDSVAVVEWGDKAEAVLPADFLEIRIEFTDEAEDERTLTLRPVGSGWAARHDALAETLGRWSVAP